MRLAYRWLREEEEGAVLLFDPFFGGGGGTVTAWSLFAAADEDATEDLFVMSRPISFLSPLFVGSLSPK